MNDTDEDISDDNIEIINPYAKPTTSSEGTTLISPDSKNANKWESLKAQKMKSNGPQVRLEFNVFKVGALVVLALLLLGKYYDEWRHHWCWYSHAIKAMFAMRDECPDIKYVTKLFLSCEENKVRALP